MERARRSVGKKVWQVMRRSDVEGVRSVCEHCNRATFDVLSYFKLSRFRLDKVEITMWSPGRTHIRLYTDDRRVSTKWKRTGPLHLTKQEAATFMEERRSDEQKHRTHSGVKTKRIHPPRNSK